jgi:Gas vesicle synthesis protein GvpL/GvpF
MTLYVYGLMRAEDGRRAETALTGASVEAIELDGVCALVTTLGEGDLTLRRESALAHSDTLQTAFKHGPVLPVRFGTVLHDEQAIRDELLAPRSATLRARLEALEGLSEMQVKATYVEEPLLRSIVGGDQRLARSAARIRQLPPAATHFERLRLGETIYNEVEARRHEDSQELVEALAPLAVAVSVRQPRHERAVLNASFLVADDRLETFDSEVERLAEREAERIRFKLIGPMPAHSFAEGEWPSGVTDGSAA